MWASPCSVPGSFGACDASYKTGFEIKADALRSFCELLLLGTAAVAFPVRSALPHLLLGSVEVALLGLAEVLLAMAGLVPLMMGVLLAGGLVAVAGASPGLAGHSLWPALPAALPALCTAPSVIGPLQMMALSLLLLFLLLLFLRLLVALVAAP